MIRTTILECVMFSTDRAHPHTATRVSDGLWEVSWIPGRAYTRGQATTATVVADYLCTQGTTDPVHLTRTDLQFLDHWASELGLLLSEMLAYYEAATPAD
jgi:hypothetical protein